jgi:hypothetical protein
LKERKTSFDKSVVLQRNSNHNTRTKETPTPKGPDDAQMDKLDSYLEKLYDDNQEQKLLATKKILELARNQDNLEELLNNGSTCTR